MLNIIKNSTTIIKKYKESTLIYSNRRGTGLANPELWLAELYLDLVGQLKKKEMVRALATVHLARNGGGLVGGARFLGLV
jgi:hypothetical protein